ncbi:hypothetical protein DL764_001377 [Monosporascus ibericus]|uniref:Uncharacterized protein n=1 Tax=Monosporascus ibericus TaxID=155417 RepID=A0A4Q4TUS0_9PEZI|nr:hypothetical protein DL764_001377 [Monosporascus ibericus]
MKLSFASGVLLAQTSLWLLPRSVHAASVDAWLVPELAAPQVVVYDDNSSNFYYSLCNSSGTPVFLGDEWDLTASPTLVLNETAAEDWSLDAFDSSAANINLTFTSLGTLSTFYIGSDRALHQIRQEDGSWQRGEEQGQEHWPLADAESSEFGIVHNFTGDEI